MSRTDPLMTWIRVRQTARRISMRTGRLFPFTSTPEPAARWRDGPACAYKLTRALNITGVRPLKAASRVREGA
jgi:hypothetical protein